MKKLVKRVRVLFRVFFEKRRISKAQLDEEVTQGSILHLLVADKTPSEIILLLETITDKVTSNLSKTRVEYKKEVQAIDAYLNTLTKGEKK
tara:strand:+ start:158 stop:430 length:273 start_codon:yes stop_codon:yes gene_type:complete